MKRVALLLAVLVVVMAAIGWNRRGDHSALDPSHPIASEASAASGSSPAPVVAAGGAPEFVDPRPPIDPGRPQSGLALLGHYSPDETRLFADVERITRRPVPAQLQRLIERRREGAGREELVALVKELGRDDVLLRATALQWVDRTMPPDGAR